MPEPDHAVKWVRVASFSHPSLAHVARLQLDEHDIPTCLDNENSAAMLWHIQPAIGGVHLCVPERCVGDARAILQEAADAAAAQEEEEEEPEADLDSSLLVYSSLNRCPKCHSPDTEVLTWRWRIAQTAIILSLGAFLMIHPIGVVLLLGYATWFLATKPARYCLRCRHRWTPRAQE